MHFFRVYSLFPRLSPLPGESFHISPLGELLNSQGPLRRRPLLSKGLPWWLSGRLSHPVPAFSLGGVLTSKEALFSLYITPREIYSISNDTQQCVCVCVCVCVCLAYMIYSIALQVGFLPLDQPRPIEREYTYNVGLSRWLSGKGSTCQRRRCRFHPSVGKIPWRRKWQPTPVLLPGKPQRQMSLAEDSPWGHRVRHDLATKQEQQYIQQIILHYKQVL